MKLTQEQQAIIDCPEDFITVNAFAGTGKTSTLEAFALAKPKKRMLYVAFNKGIQSEAERRFPSNVECRTTHSLAMRAVGRHYRHKLVDKLRLPTIIAALNLPADYGVAEAIHKTLLHFLASDQRTVAETVDQRSHNAWLLAEYTDRLWTMMCDSDDEQIGMLHDGYLKLYQLSRPRLSYDYILFDEAQDANPATTDILVNQSCRKVFVGDRHQQIYQFRGAVNAMTSLQGEQFYLTNSFRFGQSIADAGNTVLAVKDEPRRIKGLKSTGHIGDVYRKERYAVICRTNATVFDEAVSTYRTKKVHFMGGIAGYRLDRLEDGYHLQTGRLDLVRDSYIRNFGTFAELSRCVTETEDPELRNLQRMVSEYGRQIPTLVRTLREKAVDSPADADIIITTAHKAKGAEFTQVKLAEDFIDVADYDNMARSGKYKRQDLDAELNLLYVAATRAINTLQPNSEFAAALQAEH
ncbi:MAG: UvrD-helicase domain-containing protein [Pseudomonadota bacterium]